VDIFAVFFTTSQISVLASGVKRFCEEFLVYSQLARVTDRRTSRTDGKVISIKLLFVVVAVFYSAFNLD